jgi:hypothetical protein
LILGLSLGAQDNYLEQIHINTHSTQTSLIFT